MGWLFGKKKKQTRTNFKSRTPVTRKEKLLKLAQSNSFYSVTITRCGCESSSKLISKCFSFDNAPSLPLPNCTADKCTCEYQGLINHRKSERRIRERRTSIRMGDDRRQTDRRRADALWDNYTI